MDLYAKQHNKLNRALYILKICKKTRKPTEKKQHKYQYLKKAFLFFDLADLAKST